MMLINGRKQNVTKQDYGAKPVIEGVEITSLLWNYSDDGQFLEWGHLQDYEKVQLNHSIMLPGATKAFHFHEKQEDGFYCFQPLLLILHDLREDSPTKGVTMRQVICNHLAIIPKEVIHGIKNINPAPAHLFYFTTNFFDGTDEGRLPYDFLGKSIWDMTLQ